MNDNWAPVIFFIVLFMVLAPHRCKADTDYVYIFNKTTEAAYKQLKMEDMLKPLEERFVPKFVKDYVGIVSITKALVEQKIDYSWRF